MLELTTANSANMRCNVCCTKLDLDIIKWPFDGLFLVKDSLILVVDGEISKSMVKLTKDDIDVLKYSNRSLR